MIILIIIIMLHCQVQNVAIRLKSCCREAFCVHNAHRRVAVERLVLDTINFLQPWRMYVQSSGGCLKIFMPMNSLACFVNARLPRAA